MLEQFATPLHAPDDSAAFQGFADTAHDSQTVFATLMQALAHPGQIYDLDVLKHAPAPFMPASAAILLALCDFETPLWLDAASDTEPVQNYLRFHTSAPLVKTSHQADFALIADSSAMPDLTDFKLGNADYPDASTTLIIQLEAFEGGQGFALTGPGIDPSLPAPRFSPKGLRPNFFDERASLRPLFPCGLDLVFVCGTRLLGLPRSTLV